MMINERTTTMILDTRKSLVTDGNPDAVASIPADHQFDERDYLNAPDLERIGRALIMSNDIRFGFLHNARIAFLWKKDGGTSGRKVVFGKTTKANAVIRHFAEVDFVIWLGANHCRDYALSNWQLEALVYHELLHCDIDNKGKFIVSPHEFEGFLAELRNYGAWLPDLEAAASAFSQMPLFGDDAA